MVQVCCLRHYLCIDTVSCRLSLRMTRMMIFHAIRAKILWLVLPSLILHQEHFVHVLMELS